MAYVLVKARPCGVQLSSQSLPIKHNKQWHMYWSMLGLVEHSFHLRVYQSNITNKAYILVNARSCGVQISSQSLPIKHNKQWHMYWSKLGLVEYSFHLRVKQWHMYWSMLGLVEHSIHLRVYLSNITNNGICIGQS